MIIKITCPITWWERCQWLKHNSKEYTDHTNWWAWSIGLEDVYIDVDEQTATYYYLKWGE